MKVTASLVLVGASIVSVQGEGGLRQLATCPGITDLTKWAACASKTSIKEMLDCVGCTNVTPFASCTKSMGEIVGESNCETFAKPLGAAGCKTPLNVLIPEYC
jgi:hypothetical protein